MAFARRWQKITTTTTKVDKIDNTVSRFMLIENSRRNKKKNGNELCILKKNEFILTSIMMTKK